jgi:hypothetical protein
MQRHRLRGRHHSGFRESWEAVKDRYGRSEGWRRGWESNPDRLLITCNLLIPRNGRKAENDQIATLRYMAGTRARPRHQQSPTPRNVRLGLPDANLHSPAHRVRTREPIRSCTCLIASFTTLLLRTPAR